MEWIVIVILFTFEQLAIARFDEQIILFFAENRTDYLTAFFSYFTEVGSIKVMLPIAVIVCMWLILKKQYVIALLVMVNLWGVRWSNHLLKGLFERARPDAAIIDVGGYSFPSGHAMNSTAFYGFLLYLLIYQLKRTPKQKSVIVVGAVVGIFLIMMSRVYLGVHYATDVIAGFCVGALFLIWMIFLFNITLRKGRHDRPYDLI